MITDGAHFSPVPQEYGELIANVKDFGEQDIKYETCTHILKKDFEFLARQNCSPMKGDILLSKDGTIGKVILFSGERNIVLLSSIAIIRLLENYDVDYTKHVLRSFVFDKQLYALQSGSALGRIVLSDIRKLEIPYPVIKQQKKIAKILTTVDNLIEKTQALIDKYTAIKQGMMADLFTRGIDLSGTADTNPNYGQLRPSYEQAPELYKETELGWVPKDWEVLTFDEMLRRGDILGIQDGNHGEIHPKSSDFIKEGIPFVMANNLNDGRIELSGCHHISEEQYNSLRIGFSEPGDVLLSHKGTVGRVAIVGEKDGSVMLTPQVTYYRFQDKGPLNNKYVFYYFQSPQYQSLFEMLSDQSTRKYIGITEQRKFLAPVPGIEEQVKLAEQIDKISSLVRCEVQTFSCYKDVKKGLMQDLLTGKVSV